MPTLKRNEIPEPKSAVPKAPTAEKAALSILLQNYDALDAARWDADLFFEHSHRVILSAAKECHHNGHASDIFRLQSVLEEKSHIKAAGGYLNVTEIFTSYPSRDIPSALEFRQDLLKARRYRRALTKLAECRDDILSQRADLSGLAQHLSDNDDEPVKSATLKQQCADLITELEKKEKPERFSTKISVLDEKLNGGFERDTLAVWASETSGGKSIALLQTALCGACDAKKGIIFSLEMSVVQVLSRLVACQSGQRCMSAFEMPKVEQANATMAGIAAVSKLPMTIVDNLTDIESIENLCRQTKRTGLDWIVVDYLQLCAPSIDSRAETREQQVNEVTRRLKLLAIQLNICVLTASQLNKEGELRESRAVGHHADYVLHIDHKNDSIIVVNKNRNGERHVSAPVLMQGAISRFVDRALK